MTVREELEKTKANLEQACKALKQIRDVKAPSHYTHPDVWFDGFARQAARTTLIYLGKD